MATVNEKSTKAVILKAYKELYKERIALENKLKSTEKALEKANDIALKAQSSASNGNGYHPVVEEKIITKIIEKPVSIDNIEGIIHTLEGIDNGLVNATGNIAAQLSIEAEHLAALLKEKEEAIQALEKMYALKTEEGQVDQLIEEYERLFEQFEKEFEDKNDAIQEEIYGLSQSWQKEQSLQEQIQKERQDNDLKLQNRENEQYLYDLNHSRNLEDDIYNQKTKQLRDELKEMEYNQNEEWIIREKEVQQKEDEFNEYKTKFEEIPARLEKETKRAEAEGKGIIEKDTRVKTDLLSKDAESKKQIFEIRIQSLKDKIKNQEGQLGNLSKQLENALVQVQELAVKAIEGSSRTESFDALREIAIEQAKSQQKNK